MHLNFQFFRKATFVFLATLLVLSALNNQVLADEATSEQIAELNNRPQVYVSNVTIDGDSFHTGDKVNGTVTFYNSSSFDLFDLKYEIRLVSGIKTGIYKTYDKAIGGENIVVKTGESKTLTFSYVLPKRFSGDDVGLFIQSQLADGSDLGWLTSSVFNVVGGVPYLNLVGAAVSVKDTSSKTGLKDYGANIGPTIYRDKDPKSAFISFQLNNPSKEKITVTPILEISRYHSVNVEPIYRKELKDSPITVLAEEKSSRIDLPLPDFEWTPGVYTGDVLFTDGVGERSGRVSFRYIVGGEIYSVSSFSSDKSSAKKGDMLHLTFRYSGTPYDLNTTEHPASQAATVVTTLFNEGDKIVSEHKEDIDFLQGLVKEFDVKASRDAVALRAEVVIKKGSNVLAKYDFPLSANYSEAKANYKPDWLADNLSLIISITIIAVIVIVWILVKKRVGITGKKRTRKSLK